MSKAAKRKNEAQMKSNNILDDYRARLSSLTEAKKFPALMVDGDDQHRPIYLPFMVMLEE